MFHTAQGANIGIIALIVFRVCMSIMNRATEKRIAAGVMETIGVWVRKGGEWAIIHRCTRCGHLSSNRSAADDNPLKLMSVALKPLSNPPFPLERIEELTSLMGGDGHLGN